jgi:hypothetical protein
MSSVAPFSADTPESVPVALAAGEFRIGDQDGPPDLRMLAGHCSFGSPDAGLLVSLLPQILHVRGETRLSTLVWSIRLGSRSRLARMSPTPISRSLAASSNCATGAPSPLFRRHGRTFEAADQLS